VLCVSQFSIRLLVFAPKVFTNCSTTVSNACIFFNESLVEVEVDEADPPGAYSVYSQFELIHLPTSSLLPLHSASIFMSSNIFNTLHASSFG